MQADAHVTVGHRLHAAYAREDGGDGNNGLLAVGQCAVDFGIPLYGWGGCLGILLVIYGLLPRGFVGLRIAFNSDMRKPTVGS